MPIHDWTRVSSGTFHDFHQGWTIEIRNTLNSGVLPDGYYAIADQRVSGPEPDIIALWLRRPEPRGGLVVAETPPHIKRAARVETETSLYARKVRGAPPRTADRPARRQLCGLDGQVVLVPKVGLEPTPSCEDRILSPECLPTVWCWIEPRARSLYRRPALGPIASGPERVRAGHCDVPRWQS